MPEGLSDAPEDAEGTKIEVTEQDVEKAKKEMNRVYVEMLKKEADYTKARQEIDAFYDELNRKGLTSEQKEQLQRLNQAVETADSDYRPVMIEFTKLWGKFSELDTEFGNKQ